jgi:predicted TIM-barrel fold metal-dependent hydrolase
MDEQGVVLSLLHLNEPTDIDEWVTQTPSRFLAGPMLPCWQVLTEDRYFCFPETQGWPELAWLERELAEGRIGILGELTFNYSNVRPDDPRMEPYWALAAKYDVPVAVHTGRGPPPGAPPRDENCCPDYNEQLGNPELLRPVLQRHPDLRIILQHFGAGAPPHHLYYLEEALALLRDYPSVYVDLSIVNSIGPAEAHEQLLKQLTDAGFADRLMFGSDNLPVAGIVERIEAISWLSPAQRRAIFYDNAARFLRLDEGTIERHHGR